MPLLILLGGISKQHQAYKAMPYYTIKGCFPALRPWDRDQTCLVSLTNEVKRLAGQSIFRRGLRMIEISLEVHYREVVIIIYLSAEED